MHNLTFDHGNLRAFTLAAALLTFNACGDDPIADSNAIDTIQDGGGNDGNVVLQDGESPSDGVQADGATVADGVVTDVALIDGGPGDVPQVDGGAACPGGPGCECKEDADCGDGLCKPWGESGKSCAEPCTKDDDCAAESVCDAVDSADLCVPLGLAACAPCTANDQCAIGGGGSCVNMGAAGSYCGTDCDKDDDCAADQTCSAAKDVDGKDVKQCLPKSGSACSCSTYAMAIKAKTTCYADGKPGCTAERTCLAKGQTGAPADGGLTECAPSAGDKEICDAKDNDCDGEVDEGGDTLCEDDNLCTDNSCDKDNGCLNVANTANCDDGDACTKDDACAASLCTGLTVTCDDDDVCTNDSCDMAKGCTSTQNTAICDDGDACTKEDVCAVGLCAGVTLSCDDGNLCTDDSCDKETGCVAAHNKAKCDDKSACTKDDVCAVGLCAGVTLSCDDGNLCTDDSCDKETGCVAAHSKAKCDDMNACTKDDVCAVGLCAGVTLSCDDGNACTDDSCDMAKGCTQVNNTSKCDDKNACSKDDVCAVGLCAGVTINCDDDNVCTDDSCDKAAGCIVAHNSANCDDGDKCTEEDACKGGNCDGAKVSCDDANACTTDACAPKTGCTHAKMDKGPCQDGSVCTLTDTCKAGACSAGAQKDCADGNACTADSCDAKTGCANTKIKDGSECDDGDKCTTKETCKAKKCESGGKTDCDDGDLCSADSCDTKAGCQHKPIVGCGSKPFALPYHEPFICGSGSSKLWKLGGYDKGPGWAVDGTPAKPGYKSPKCSLNFNNGTHYECSAGLKNLDKLAISPAVDLAQAKLPQLVYQLGGDWEGNSYDDVTLSISIDGGKAWKLLANYNDSGANVWAKKVVDLSAYKGKTVMFAWRFFTKDCLENDTSGAFIDDITIDDMACGSDKDCDDGNTCTTDTCVVATGACKHGAGKDGLKCDDGSMCTLNTCKGGKCTITSTKKCDDGNACTYKEACSAKDGECHVGYTETCNDNNSCTTDACDPKTAACSNKPIAGCKPKCKVDDDCDDNNICTVDTCATKAGICAFTPGKVGALCGEGQVCGKTAKCQDITGGWARQLSGHPFGYHYCATTWDHRVACWGANSYYESGVAGSKASVSKPTLVKGNMAGVKKVSAGRYHSCAVGLKGEVWCWGRNSSGQSAPGAKTLATATPYKIPGLGAALDVTAGNDSTCVLHMDRTVSCWGYNYTGRLGHGDTQTQPTPKKVKGLSNVRTLEAGSSHICVTRMDGSLWCAGSNSNYETSEVLGNKYVFTKRAGVPKLTRAVVGYTNTCGGNEGAWGCVGDNYYGQLGDGSTADSKSVVLVKGPAGPAAMDAGYYNHLALTPNGEVWAVGYDSYGEFGLGSTSSMRKKWLKTAFGPSVDADSSFRVTCALYANGQVWCSGYNYYRSLGNGSNSHSNKPVRTIGLCANNGMCDDGNPCTIDSCDVKTAACVHKFADGVKCDDGAPCTVNDVCAKGVCGGNPMICDDKNACTLGEKCVADKDGKPTCSKGTPTVCDDQKVCTKDSCDIKTGKCLSQAIPGCVPPCKSSDDCNDGNACTLDICALGKCIAKPGNDGKLCAVGKICGAGKCAPSGKGWATKISGATNGRHFCAVGTDAKAWCWGEGADYRLGVASTTDRSKPVAVPGLSGVTDVVACYSHSCARAKGKWYCWGDNSYGAVGTGNGSSSDISKPTEVKVATGVTQMTCGYRYTCGLLATGKVRCWGYQSSGRLGHGKSASGGLPKGAEVKGLTNVVELWSAYAHSCARKSDGTVWCWGTNNDKQLSAVPLSAFTSPVEKKDAKGAAFASGSYNTVCWGAGGKGWCAGDNDNGQLGKKASADSPSGVATVGTPPVAYIDGGFDHNAMLAQDGSVWATGDNDQGQLGIGSAVDQHKWVKSALPLGLMAVQVDASGDTTCVLTSAGTVHCVGNGGNGQLGGGGTSDQSLYGAVAVHCAAGAKCQDGDACTISDACVLGYCQGKPLVCNDNNVCTQGDICVGKNGAPSCQPGANKMACDDFNPCTADSCDAKTGCKFTPVKGCLVKCKSAADCNDHNTCTKDICNTSTGACVLQPANSGLICADGKTCGNGKCQGGTAGWAKQIASDPGGKHVCALTHKGTVACWGNNSNGQVGNGSKSDQSKPVLVKGLSGVVKVAVGYAHSCALGANGKVMCWGYNSYGQMGNGSSNSSDVTKPTAATTVPPLTDLWAGYNGNCGRGADGNFYCWGYGGYGERGDGTTTSAGSTAKKVVGLPSGVMTLHLGHRRRCALYASGDVWCWGYNNFRDVSTNSNSRISSPTKRTNVGGLGNIGGGRYFSCGTQAAKNQTLCWGDNDQGQFGYGSKSGTQSAPKVVKGLPGMPALLRGGDDHSLMLMANGALYAAGDGYYYQLGNKSSSDRTTAVRATLFSMPLVSVTGPYNSTCGLGKDGQVYCLGMGTDGQLGYGSKSSSSSLKKVIAP